MTTWLTILGMGVVTFGTRLLPFLAVERFELPARLRQALGFTPAAVLSAIIAQEVLAPGGDVSISADNLRIFAAALALVVAVVSRNILATIATGMVALWLLRWIQ